MSDFAKDTNVPANDCISRQDAIKAIRCGHLSAATIYGRSDEGMMVLAESIRAIDSLPSAQPERKKGKWYEDEEIGLCKCDQCHGVNLIHTPFCPMCGAKMEMNDGN